MAHEYSNGHRKLSAAAVAVLMAWMTSPKHFSHPYPADEVPAAATSQYFLNIECQPLALCGDVLVLVSLVHLLNTLPPNVTLSLSLPLPLPPLLWPLSLRSLVIALHFPGQS